MFLIFGQEMIGRDGPGWMPFRRPPPAPRRGENPLDRQSPVLPFRYLVPKVVRQSRSDAFPREPFGSAKDGGQGESPRGMMRLRGQDGSPDLPVEEMVPKVGVEPTRPFGPLDFESSASTSSATSA